MMDTLDQVGKVVLVLSNQGLQPRDARPQKRKPNWQNEKEENSEKNSEKSEDVHRQG